jgi:glycosyltransferase involved in cell wall biosynthesis
VALHAKNELNVPLVSTFHTLIPEYFSYYFFRSQKVENYIWKYFVDYFKKCDAVTTPSELVKKKIDSKLSNKVTLIPNGVDINRFHPKNKSDIYESRFKTGGKKIILHIGRMSKERNIPMMIEAFEQLIRKRNDVILVLVGEGPEKEKMMKMSKNMGDNVIFTGYMPNDVMPDLYASAYAFMTTSKTDVHPLVLLESFASGTPVIGIDAGGV